MFRIIGGKGFHIEFLNGYTVSVQWGPGNYCDHYDQYYTDEFNMFSLENSKIAGEKGSETAECAIWTKDGSLIAHPTFEGDTVGGYMTPEQVLELLNWAASQ
jgi:hypothetical protein